MKPVDTPTNAAVTGSVTVDTPIGMTLDPSELVADSHDVKASTYKPFQWKYEKGKTGSVECSTWCNDPAKHARAEREKH